MQITAHLLALTCLCFASTSFAAEPSAGPLTVLSTTPLPAVTGGDFDHFAVDLPHSRLYVSAEKYGSIEVFRLPDGQHLASVRTVAKVPHKIVLANEGKELLIADAGDANVKVIDTKTFDIEKVVPLEPQPDSGIADRKSGIFYVGNGGAQSHEGNAYISLISLADDSVLGRIDVPAAQLKAMVIDHSPNGRPSRTAAISGREVDGYMWGMAADGARGSTPGAQAAARLHSARQAARGIGISRKAARAETSRAPASVDISIACSTGPHL